MPAPTTTDPVLRWLERREKINRENSTHSTGPRTPEGKRVSSRNALTHGLTARSPVLPSEDRAAYEAHCRAFLDEYHPATPTETQLVQELADTAWRQNRIPKLEANLLLQGPSPQSLAPQLASLGLHSSRLSRQFQKTLATLRELQAERAERERRQLRDAAELLVHHQHKGLPWEPADDGFVFSKQEVDRHVQLLTRLNQARHTGFVRFQVAPPLTQAAGIR